ncbi:hypothetical protein N0V88_007618 [Collariella sp. IMI 366227]|nr:hypothetical protein N0V88_007618 [Collariella sp. IMI 366227]
MSRFNLFTRGSNAGSNQGDATADPYDDRVPLSPRIIPDDIEAQPTSAAAAAASSTAGGNAEMVAADAVPDPAVFRVGSASDADAGSLHEFMIVLIVIIVGITIFFCHSLVQLCILAVKARKRRQAAQQGRRTPEMVGPDGYAIPSEPIPVVLARDEEAVGIQSEATKTGPPAYGMWRESVRVDPDRLYWARNERAPPLVDEVSEGSSLSDSGSAPSAGSRPGVHRPPSYLSDDGSIRSLLPPPPSPPPVVTSSASIASLTTRLHTVHTKTRFLRRKAVPPARYLLRLPPPPRLRPSRSRTILIRPRLPDIDPRPSITMFGTLARTLRACHTPVGAYQVIVNPTRQFSQSRPLANVSAKLLRMVGRPATTPNHESNECPMPRTTKAKQCYHCQGIGHVQAECPTLRLSGGVGANNRCYNCESVGHLARNCPNPPAALGRGAPVPRGGFAPRGGFTGAPRPATCYKCGGPNHFARDCQAQAMKCYACGKLGHISRDCTAPNGGPLNTAGKSCYQCGESGHISRDCTKKAGPNGEMQGDVDMNGSQAMPAQPAPPVAPVA